MSNQEIEHRFYAVVDDLWKAYSTSPTGEPIVHEDPSEFRNILIGYLVRVFLTDQNYRETIQNVLYFMLDHGDGVLFVRGMS